MESGMLVINLDQKQNKQTVMFMERNIINVTIQENVQNIKKIKGIEVRIVCKLADARKHLFITCEDSSQNLGISKISTSNIS